MHPGQFIKLGELSFVGNGERIHAPWSHPWISNLFGVLMKVYSAAQRVLTSSSMFQQVKLPAPGINAVILYRGVNRRRPPNPNRLQWASMAPLMLPKNVRGLLPTLYLAMCCKTKEIVLSCCNCLGCLSLHYSWLIRQHHGRLYV